MNAIQLVPVLLAPLLLQGNERRPVGMESSRPATQVPVALELSLYEIGHLLELERSDDLKDLLRSSAGRTAGASELERLDELVALRERSDAAIESVSRAIHDMMRPVFEPRQGRIERLDRQTLAVIASPEQHAWLRDFLEHASSFDGLVDVQARIVLLERGGLARLEQVRSSEVLALDQVERLLERLAQGDSDEIVAPRVIVHPFQQAELTAVEQTAYVADYELRILPGQDLEIADPVIETAESGVHLRLRCVPLASGKLSLDASIVHSTLATPIPTVNTTIGARGDAVTLQVPEITRVRLEGRFEVQPGETLVMASTDPAGDKEVLVLVRAALVDAVPENEAPQALRR